MRSVLLTTRIVPTAAMTDSVFTNASTTRSNLSAPANSVPGIALNAGKSRSTSPMRSRAARALPERSTARLYWRSAPSRVRMRCAWAISVMTPPSSRRLPVRNTPVTRTSRPSMDSVWPGSTPIRRAATSPTSASSEPAS